MPIRSQELLKRNHQAISELLRREISSNAEFDAMDLDRIAQASTNLAAYEALEALLGRAKDRVSRYQCMMSDIAYRVLDDGKKEVSG